MVTTCTRLRPLCTSWVDRGAARPIGTEGSRAHRAASRALLSRTDWMYWVVKYAEPIIANMVIR